MEEPPITYHKYIEQEGSALMRKRKELGPEVADDHLEVAQCYENLAMVYFTWEMDYKALHYHKAALGVRTRNYGCNACRAPDVALSLVHIAIVYNELGDYNEARKDLTQAIDIYHSAYGEHAHHEKIAWAFNQFGITMRKLYKYTESLEYHTMAMGMYKNIYGSNTQHKYIANTYKYIADLAKDQASYQSAMFNYNKSSMMYRYVYGDYFIKDPNSAPAMQYVQAFVGMGDILDIEGKRNEALLEYRRGMQIIRLHFGHDEHTDIMYAEFFDREGLIRLRDSIFSIAERRIRDALDIKLAHYENEIDHPSIGRSHVHLGDLSLKKHEWDAAKKRYNQAIVIYNKIHQAGPVCEVRTPPCHPDIARCFLKLGHIKYETAMYDKALDLYEEAYDMFETFYGKGEIQTDLSETIAFKSRAYCAKGDFDMAHHLIYEALQMNKKITAGNLNHPLIAENYKYFANVFVAQDEYHQAIQYYTKSLTVINNMIGDAKVQSIVDLHNLMGHAHLNHRKLQESLKSYVAANAVVDDIYEDFPGHIEIARCQRNVAYLYFECDYFGNALQHFEECEQKFLHFSEEQHLEIENPEISLVDSGIGAVLLQLENFELALEKFQMAEKALNKCFGDRGHPLKVDVYQEIGMAYTKLKQYSEAMNYYQKALHASKDCYGVHSKHPLIAECHYFIGNTYASLERYESAVVSHERALTMKLVYEDVKNRSIANSFSGLADAHLGLDEYAKALDYMVKCLEMRTHLLFGADEKTESDMAESYCDFARYYSKRKEYSTSIAYYKRASDIYKHLDDYPMMAESLDSLGRVQFYSNLYSDSIRSHKRALKFWEILYKECLDSSKEIKSDTQEVYEAEKERVNKMCQGKYSLNMAYSHLYIGNAYMSDGSGLTYLKAGRENVRFSLLKHAFESYFNALELFLGVYGEKDKTEIADVYNNCGLVLQTTSLQQHTESLYRDSYDRALEYHHKALAMRKAIHGENVPNRKVTESLKNIGMCLGLRGELSKALSHFSDAWDMYIQIFGEDPVEECVAELYEGIGVTYFKGQDYKKALEYYERTKNARISLYGEFRQYCLPLASIYKNLGDVYNAIGNEEKGNAYYSLAQRVVQKEGTYDVKTNGNDCVVM